MVYGIGQCGFALMLFLNALMGDVEIVAFCDRKAGNITEFFGYKVISVFELLKDYGDVIVIVTPVAQKAKDEIVSSLAHGGLSRGQIIENVPFDLWALRGQYFDEVINLRGVKSLLTWDV